ncbi:MAG: chromosome segregation protein SMC, partial [Gammaproteobacteria bacterium]|nr:chromosome segregation protein SMC [Gammaproteobacteria bacterium]
QQARGLYDEAVAITRTLDARKTDLEQQRDELRSALEKARDLAQADKELAHEVELKAGSMQTALVSTQENIARMEGRFTKLTSRREELQTALANGEEPVEKLKGELEVSLSKRVDVEGELSRARDAVQAIESAMKQLNEDRHVAEEKVQGVREQLEKMRLGWQEMNVRRETMKEQIDESGFELKKLQEEMPEEANEPDWVENVENLERKINRLGAINLAAIDEYEEQSKRKEYLDAQHADVSEALNTLETAIQKIDRETRTKFKETFDKVNSGIQKIFPRLFGGGQAHLELVGDDLLDTGVTIMARPPGKRISSIQLLSGGEKALTAVSLVFAIFELNPAPFCLLDEVDAPLDDANVGRFCEMVKERSSSTQFIFITHNKITMEIANQLVGVTMQEAGVSRLVAVDVDEAVQLVAV